MKTQTAMAHLFAPNAVAGEKSATQGLVGLLVLAVSLSFALVDTALAQPQSAQAPTTRVTQSGLLGDFYPRVGGGEGPAILLLGGSEGGLGGSKSAHSLAEQGYSVLSLAYFGAPGLPPKLRLIPLEYFATALQWLRAQPQVDPDRVGLVATSKGAEAALLVAVRDKKIAAVAVGAPQSVVWIAPDSCGEDETSSWSEGGRPLEPLPCGHGARVFDSLTAYRSGLRMLAQHPATRIPVEQIVAPILLECGEADSLGPSCDMARQIQKSAGAGKVLLLAYRKAGHASFGPPIEPSSPAYVRLASLGGTVAGNALARDDSWSKLLIFLKSHLNP